jgi:hypothetical protein
MSPLGNLVFVPFLSTTLFLCSCLFAAFFCGFEPQLLIFALKKIVAIWQWCLALGSPRWMIGFSFPGVIGLTILSLIAWFVLRSYVIRRFIKREFLAPLVLLGYCLILVIFTFFTQTTQPTTLIIPETNNQLMLVTDTTGTTTLTDTGFFSTIRDPQKFIAYSLRPYLIKNYGITHINQGKINSASKKNFNALNTITIFYAPHQIDVPWFNALEKKEWHSFFSMKRFALPTEREKSLRRKTFKKNLTNAPTHRQRKKSKLRPD